MSLLVRSPAATPNARRALAPAGPHVLSVPAVLASYCPTARTVVPAGTSNVSVPVIERVSPDAAAHVSACRAYAGEPPVTSLPPDGGKPVCRLRCGVPPPSAAATALSSIPALQASVIVAVMTDYPFLTVWCLSTGRR